MATAAWISELVVVTPTVPGSSLRYSEASDTMAPADSPIMTMRSGSMPYGLPSPPAASGWADQRSHRTRAWASWRAAVSASYHTAGQGGPSTPSQSHGA